LQYGSGVVGGWGLVRLSMHCRYGCKPFHPNLGVAGALAIKLNLRRILPNGKSVRCLTESDSRE
jgi:hypothetical protein